MREPRYAVGAMLQQIDTGLVGIITESHWDITTFNYRLFTPEYPTFKVIQYEFILDREWRVLA